MEECNNVRKKSVMEVFIILSLQNRRNTYVFLLDGFMVPFLLVNEMHIMSRDGFEDLRICRRRRRSNPILKLRSMT